MLGYVQDAALRVQIVSALGIGSDQSTGIIIELKRLQVARKADADTVGIQATVQVEKAH